ncbi:MAG: alpha-glucuronidase family glycosyl hydrolase [bacterium]
MFRKTTLFFIILVTIFCITEYALPLFQIVENKNPLCQIIISESKPDYEVFSADELNYFIEKMTGTQIAISIDSKPLSDGNKILIGTYESNRYIRELYNNGFIMPRIELKEEEYIVKTISDNERNYIVVLGADKRGTIYGTYELIKKMVERFTGLKTVDLDMHITQFHTLAIEELDIRSSPFYPIRCALSKEDPVWMSRHQLNISGAEGIWDGTGINDGLGSAFKYVYDSQFDDYQDESFDIRWNRIMTLRRRFRSLDEKGIDSYLFMYVMGEPTKAMMRNHPEMLEETVKYSNSRNGEWYKPISWTKPQARNLIKELVKSIVNTYSPWLKGLHLRSWGWETRAPADNNEQQQKLLWEIYLDIINSAMEVNPNIKFIISGYDAHWLKDPKRTYASMLPKGTILVVKWGVDGEPTNDPGITPEFINSIGKYGHKVLILSHDTEEVMPFWMLESDMFVEGVRRYANNPNINGLGGFTIQGEIGFSHLDKIVSSAINFNPFLDYISLMRNYLISYYGQQSAENILYALRINSVTLSDFLSDYAGLLSLTGHYGNGSRGYATRFWDIIGVKAVKDTLSMPDIKAVEYAKERLSSLLPKQQESANRMSDAKKTLMVSSDLAEWNYLDGFHLMRVWVRFFESRLRLVEALELGFTSGTVEQISQKLSSAIGYSKEMQSEIAEIKQFVNVFDYDHDKARDSLINSINDEISFLKILDPKKIVTIHESDEINKSTEFRITDVMIHPNPMNKKAYFCYNLSSSAEEVTITIYSIMGRRLRTIYNASAKKGYNEEGWDARDDNGASLSSGTYFFKIIAKKENKKSEQIGKLSIIR